jgi:hypothetical protein
MRSEPITKELREYVRLVRAFHPNDIHGKKREYVEATTTDMLELADRIDREHERRMADSRREMRRAAVRYMRSVFDDYYHGIKRKRPQ